MVDAEEIWGLMRGEDATDATAPTLSRVPTLYSERFRGFVQRRERLDGRPQGWPADAPTDFRKLDARAQAVYAFLVDNEATGRPNPLPELSIDYGAPAEQLLEGASLAESR